MLPESTYAGEEATVTMAYVNKGKADIANVEASIEGEGIESAVPSQYLGNVASGGTGAVGFAFTPLAAGEVNATLRISYEDPNGEAKTRDFPITLNVSESIPDTDEGMDLEPEPEPTVPLWAWIAGGAALAVPAVALAVVLARRRRARHAARQTDDGDWDDWDGGDSEAGTLDGVAADDAGASGFPARSGDGIPPRRRIVRRRRADAGHRRRGRWDAAMRFADILRLCRQNLLRRKSRTVLTVLGVVVGCCSIVLMVSLGAGINEQNERMLESMGDLEHHHRVCGRFGSRRRNRRQTDRA